MNQPDPGAWAQAWAPFARLFPGMPESPAAAPVQAADAGTPAPPWAGWVAPVLDVDELDRRIRDLQAVHFWLEQNARALQATIQALQVQRMTLAALRSMNVGWQTMAQAGATAAAQGAAAAAPSAEAPAAGSAPSAGAAADAAPAGGVAPDFDPVRWWRALSEQFQTIAQQTVADAARGVATSAPNPAPNAQGASAPPPAAPAAPRRAGRRAPPPQRP
ncbi:PhaM family polyhydroxyalkanoate granule multifunctional regulatory protein [Tepidimonas ignava]|uniref:PhaM family polyhydroxyalkanoate granule multifunctional regulatory protein n=1 Tax=Tepidimonas ignava TaxID=114249 RepID=UPI002FD96D9A